MLIGVKGKANQYRKRNGENGLTIPEVARSLKLPIATVRRWFDSGILQTSGRDLTRPGHPWIVSEAELGRLRKVVKWVKKIHLETGLRVGIRPRT
jgi:hypothetical protein